MENLKIFTLKYFKTNKNTAFGKEPVDVYFKIDAEQYAKVQVLKELQYIRKLTYDCFNPPHVQKIYKRI
jgi:D-alanyl-D-alanine dipeptidase